MATWTDWLDQNASKGVRRYVPTSVLDVVSAVTAQPKLRTVGARHADNQLGRPNDGTAMIDPKFLTGTSLVKKVSGGALVYIRAGTRICDVNEQLWDMGYALPNMGSFDQQYFAGAVATGTHGSGASLGPLADLLRAVDLVDGTGQCWRVEDPAQPTTTKSAFSKSNPKWKLEQNDLALWRSVGVNAGALGSVVGVILYVMDAYKLWETRRAGTWEAQPKTTTAWKTLLGTSRHFELLICPYPSDDGTHFAVVTKRDLATDDVADKRVPDASNDGDELPPSSRHFLHELQRWVRREGGQLLPLGEILVNAPELAPDLLRKGMNSLIPKKPKGYDFVDRNYRILLLGMGVKAHGFEMAIPLENLNKVVDVIFAIAAEWNRSTDSRHDRCLFTSPFAVRFVAGGPQFIGTNGKERAGGASSDVWAFIEMPRLLIHDEEEKNREYPNYPNAAVRSIWHAVRPYGVRAHWGQHEFLVPTDLPALYPNLDAWKNQANRLDPLGRFANARALQIGLR